MKSRKILASTIAVILTWFLVVSLSWRVVAEHIVKSASTGENLDLNVLFRQLVDCRMDQEEIYATESARFVAVGDKAIPFLKAQSNAGD